MVEHRDLPKTIARRIIRTAVLYILSLIFHNNIAVEDPGAHEICALEVWRTSVIFLVFRKMIYRRLRYLYVFRFARGLINGLLAIVVPKRYHRSRVFTTSAYTL